MAVPEECIVNIADREKKKTPVVSHNDCINGHIVGPCSLVDVMMAGVTVATVRDRAGRVRMDKDSTNVDVWCLSLTKKAMLARACHSKNVTRVAPR